MLYSLSVFSLPSSSSCLVFLNIKNLIRNSWHFHFEEELQRNNTTNNSKKLKRLSIHVILFLDSLSSRIPIVKLFNSWCPSWSREPWNSQVFLLRFLWLAWLLTLLSCSCFTFLWLMIPILPLILQDCTNIVISGVSYDQTIKSSLVERKWNEMKSRHVCLDICLDMNIFYASMTLIIPWH